jgi:hypothetical protein
MKFTEQVNLERQKGSAGYQGRGWTGALGSDWLMGTVSFGVMKVF